MKSRIIITILITALVCILILYTIDKPNIEDASMEQIQAIEGIGKILSLRIVNYIGDSETFDIDDLINVKGIGEERLRDIRRDFK